MTEPTSTAHNRDHPERPKHPGHPGHPNFLLIVILFAVTIIVILFAAWLLIGDKGKKLLPGRHTAHPTSHVLPAPSDTAAA
jgi:hypothetical protein